MKTEKIQRNLKKYAKKKKRSKKVKSEEIR